MKLDQSHDDTSNLKKSALEVTALGATKEKGCVTTGSSAAATQGNDPMGVKVVYRAVEREKTNPSIGFPILWKVSG
jgi:hypothetical protein